MKMLVTRALTSGRGRQLTKLTGAERLPSQVSGIVLGRPPGSSKAASRSDGRVGSDTDAAADLAVHKVLIMFRRGVQSDNRLGRS